MKQLEALRLARSLADRTRIPHHVYRSPGPIGRRTHHVRPDGAAAPSGTLLMATLTFSEKRATPEQDAG